MRPRGGRRVVRYALPRLLGRLGAPGSAGNGDDAVVHLLDRALDLLERGEDGRHLAVVLDREDPESRGLLDVVVREGNLELTHDDDPTVGEGAVEVEYE